MEHAADLVIASDTNDDGQDELLFFRLDGRDGGAVWQVTAATGETVWESPLPPSTFGCFDMPVAYTKDVLVTAAIAHWELSIPRVFHHTFSTSTRLTAHRLADGLQLWSFELDKDWECTGPDGLTAIEDVCYALVREREASAPPMLLAIDGATGRLRWRTELANRQWLSPIEHDEQLLLRDRSGEAAFVAPATGHLEPLAPAPLTSRLPCPAHQPGQVPPLELGDRRLVFPADDRPCLQCLTLDRADECAQAEQRDFTIDLPREVVIDDMAMAGTLRTLRDEVFPHRYLPLVTTTVTTMEQHVRILDIENGCWSYESPGLGSIAAPLSFCDYDVSTGRFVMGLAGLLVLFDPVRGKVTNSRRLYSNEQAWLLSEPQGRSISQGTLWLALGYEYLAVDLLSGQVVCTSERASHCDGSDELRAKFSDLF